MYLRVQYFFAKNNQNSRKTFRHFLRIHFDRPRQQNSCSPYPDGQHVYDVVLGDIQHGTSINSQLTHNLQVNNSEIFFFVLKSPHGILISFLCWALLNHRSETKKNFSICFRYFICILSTLFVLCYGRLWCFCTQMDSIT